jgi:autotransporter-associated beta strand protein
LISGGTLAFSSGGSLSSTGSVTVNTPGTLDITLAGGNQIIGDLSGTGSVILSSNLSTGGSNASTTFSGGISGGGALTKIGTGKLTLTGSNSYTGGTNVSNGTLEGNTASLQGNISNTAIVIFNQTVNGAYSDTLTGAGQLEVTGSGILNIVGSLSQNLVTVGQGGSGTLAVNTANFTCNTLTVNTGGTLKGTGTISGTVFVASGGSLSPSNSPGTMSITGDVTLSSGSFLDIEIDPNAVLYDHLNLTGSFTIGSDATLIVYPEEGFYPSPSPTYTIVTADGGVFGEFDSVVNFVPSIVATPAYDANHVYLNMNVIPINNLPLDKEALIVARCLAPVDPARGSDLEQITNALRFMSIAQMESTLHEMLPSLFNVLDLSQETTLIDIRETLSREMNYNCNKECGASQKVRVWGDYFSSSSSQHSSGINAGYDTRPRGAVAGVDIRIGDTSYFGGGCGYARTPFEWKREQGSGSSTSAFGSLYGGGFFNRYFYGQGALIGGMNFYHTKRNIVFNTLLSNVNFTRVAKGKTSGLSVLSHFETGLIYERGITIRPSLKLDYLFLVREAFSEQGADSVDLVVERHVADLLRTEVGIEFRYCLPVKCSFRSIPYVSAGDIYEARFMGKTETASLVDLHCPMTASGLFPEQNLLFLQVGLIEQTINDHLLFSGNYRTEWGKNYDNQTWSVQMRFSF